MSVPSLAGIMAPLVNVSALCAGCKQCKHPGNRKSSVKKHTKTNPCPCCPASFVQEHETCQARPDQPCQCDFHSKEVLRAVDKVSPLLSQLLCNPGQGKEHVENALLSYVTLQPCNEKMLLTGAAPCCQNHSWNSPGRRP